MAELAALREHTVEQAAELRDLELARFDEMTAGIWPEVQKGNPPAVTAAVRVSERRSRLLGLDEPGATRTEISASLSVTSEARIKTQVEDLLRWLSFEELAVIDVIAARPLLFLRCSLEGSVFGHAARRRSATCRSALRGLADTVKSDSGRADRISQEHGILPVWYEAD